MSTQEDIEEFKQLTGLDPFSCNFLDVMVEYDCYPVCLRNKGMIIGYAFHYPIPIKVRADNIGVVDTKVYLITAIIKAVIWKIKQSQNK